MTNPERGSAASLLVLLGAATVAAQQVDTVEKLEALPSLNRLFWLQAPPARKAPTIDGTLSLADGEWADASCFYGMSVYRQSIQVPIPAWTYVTWDKANIYLGLRTMLPEGGRLRRRCREHDGEVNHDDAMEIIFNPLGRGQAEPAMYRAMVNGLGYVNDEKIFVGVFARNWNGHWLVKTDYRAGMDHWDVEMAIPTKSMGIEEPNRSGHVWRFLITRNWKKLLDPQTGRKLWNIYSSLGTSVGFAYVDAGGGLVLNDQAPVVQLVDMKDLHHGRLGLTARLANTTARSLELVARVKAFAATGGKAKETDDWLKRPGAVKEFSRKFRLAAGGEASWTLPAETLSPLPERAKGQRREMVFAVDSADARSTFYRLQRGFAAWELKADVGPYVLPLSMQYNPVRNNAKVTCDLLDDPNRKQARGVLAEVYDVGCRPGRDKPLVTAKVMGVRRDIIQGVFRLPPLARTGEYPAVARLLGDGDRVLATSQSTFEKLDEAREFPWWQSRAGILDKPVPPHRDMKYRGNTVMTTTGRYTFNGTGLPAQISMTGEPLLAAPVRLLCSIGGKPVPFRSPAAPRVTKQSVIEADLAGELLSDRLDMNLANHIEYDGCMKISLSVKPKGGPADVDSLRLEIPLRRRRAEMLWSFAQDCRVGLLLADLTGKEGLVWNSFDRKGFRQAVGTFWPQYVLTDSFRGLCWFADNDRGWVPTDDVPAAEVERRGQETIFRLNFIGRRFRVTRPRRIVFGLLGLPGRPLPAGWRLYHRRAENFGNYVGDKVMNYSPPMPRDFKKAQAYMAKGTVYDRTTFEPRGKSGKWHPSFEFAPWHDSHAMFRTPDIDPRFFRYCALELGGPFTQTAIDYKAWLINEYVRQTDIAGLYFDTPDAIGHSSEISSGVAYVIPDDQPGAGKVQPGYTIFGWREYVKRVRGIFYAHGRENPWLEMHATHGPIAATTPFLEIRTEGEGFRLPASRNFMAAWSRLHLRAIDVPPLYGIVTRWLSGYPWDGQVPNVDPQRCKIGALMLHDIFTGWGREFGQCRSVYHKQAPSTRGPMFGYKRPNVSQKLIAHGFNREEVRYLPYWQNQALLALAGSDGKPVDNVLGSVWHVPSQRKALVVLANYNEGPVRGLTVRLGVARLGLLPAADETLAAADFETGEPLPATPVVDLPPLDFAMLIFARAKATPTGPLAQVEISKHEGRARRPSISPAAVRRDLLIHGLLGPDVKALAANVLAMDGATEAIKASVYHLPGHDKALVVLRNTGKTVPLKLRLDVGKLKLVPVEPGRNLLVMDLRSGSVLQETTHRSRGRQFFRSGGAAAADLGAVGLTVRANDTVLLLFAKQ